ncbi:hypothetical protein, partial [Escherichia coli]
MKINDFYLPLLSVI